MVCVESASDLALQGWVVRAGANYGADYVLYDRHPSEAHSSYCVLALTGSKRPERIRWTDIEAASRVCSTVCFLGQDSLHMQQTAQSSLLQLSRAALSTMYRCRTCRV